MTNYTLQFNPFNDVVTPIYTNAELSELFNQAKVGKRKAINKLIKHYSPFVEQNILQVGSSKLINKAFSIIYFKCIAEIKNAIKKLSLNSFERFFTWIIKQTIITKI